MIVAVLEVLAFLVLPVAAFLAGAAWMQCYSGARRRPGALNLRFGGYDARAVAGYWHGEDLDAERQLLRLDLAFPVYYGANALAAFAFALSRLGLDDRFGWAVALVAIVMVADWIENTIQLAQLARYAGGGEAALQPSAVRVASVATQVKLAGSTALVVANLALGAWMLVQAFG